ncbi:uncharacterized protein BJX67DRAFT_382953 [Aspergillus lucknowensis]|uniref:F-box domain-containing protein n=1 Tax=Aspergillus lucknowensis TaxID=176173 RepID=A0ABR4LKX8_9EURO
MPHFINKLLGFVRLSKRRANYELLSSHGEPPRSPLLELPLDILLLIVPHLPLVSQVCLALTCKPLYQLLHSALDDERLAWPRYLTSPITPFGDSPYELFGSNPEIPRNNLLLKLEDSRWLYCCDCLKLHRSYQFDRWAVDRVPPSSRYCGNNVGVVDLCACLALTYSNGVQLASWIQRGVPSRYLHRNIRQEFQFRVIKNKRCLLHNCSVTSQPDAFVALTTMVTLDADSCLIVTTRYNVYWSLPHKALGEAVESLNAYRPPHNTEGIFLCPHMHALAWIYGRYARCTGYQYECRCCDTKSRMLLYNYDGFHSVIQGERNLGIIRYDTYRLWEHSEHPWRWQRASRRPGNRMEKLWYKPF